MSRLSGFILAIGFLTTTSVSAQNSSQLGLTEVRPEQVVRIRTSQGQLVEGRFSTSPARDATIDSLWVRGNRAKTGALIGGLVLGVGSAVGWNQLCEIANEGHGCDETGEVIVFGIAGAAVGAGLGALIGSAARTWRLQYVRPGAHLRLNPVSLNRVQLSVTLPL